MLKPTIMIKKKKIFNDMGWNRYYGTFKINLNEVGILTEAQLCRFILDNFGEGKFMVFAWMKGHKGFWVFWKGEIFNNGFIFEKKKGVDTDDINYLKKELEEEVDIGARNMLYQMISDEIHDNKRKRYGFSPYLNPSGRRGDFVHWEDGLLETEA